jgi:hypothetical protein
MPRQMRRFDLDLLAQAQLATSIVGAGEATRLAGGVGLAQWSIIRLEALYELAYLRVFATWEMCFEEIFFRSLCGFASNAGGQETLVAGAYFPTLAAAEAAVFGGNQFLLWANPAKVIQRCQQFIVPGVQEDVISSNLARLTHFASIRHRIVHVHQQDAKNKFDAATIFLAGHPYPASRPGKFLRAVDGSVPPRKWLDVLVDELVALAGQIV